MEKLQKYNQRLVAVLLTLITLFIIVGGMIMLGVFFFKMFDSNEHDRSLVASSDKEEEARLQQHISLGSPYLIDSTKNVYLVPVEQTSPDHKEKTRKMELYTGSASKSSYSEVDNYSLHYGYYGKFNNFILYGPLQEKKERIFNERISFNQFQFAEVDSTKMLFFRGTSKDSDGDNKLTEDDLQDFYIYNVKSSKLYQYSHKDAGFVDFKILNIYELILRFRKDLNNNGVYDDDEEPVFVKKVNLETMEEEKFLDDKEKKELQQIIDGD
ncbi:MAG: hypothetical protein ABEH43_11175 [Flavobacteriales bacterium]